MDNRNDLWRRIVRICWALLICCVLAALGADAQSYSCIGDCNADTHVTIDELVTGVDMIMGADVDCPAFECNDGVPAVRVNCLVIAVLNAGGSFCVGP